ncbi:dynamin family protein [uncultured Modestobacter sp.]|uniref:dynamin family protein n=1 Tax=uncultured Modestobacter sp. TaxID=380048 RepID=UPI00260B4A47|nr:dynamin family protein [uncultured Modestobacter sp.]
MATAPRPTDLLERLAELSSTRADLLSRLAVAQARGTAPGVRAVVVGELKQGKSALVNALVTAPVCPVDDDVATAVPTVVRGGASASAALVHTPGSAPVELPLDDELDRTPVAIPALGEHLTRTTDPDDARRLVRAEVVLPRALLSGGLQLVDTPGADSAGTGHSATTLTVLPAADVVLFVSDASQEFTAPELELLQRVVAGCPTVLCVLTKTDLYPDWREVRDRDAAHLAAAGLDLPLLPVSATLEMTAVTAQDRELHAESGFPALLGRLRELAGSGAELAHRSLVHDLTVVTEELTASARSELAALLDPAHAEQLVADLERARDEVDRLRRRSSRWQQLLNDGVADLIADIDHDLRDRVRAVTREAEDAIDAADPGPLWGELTAWLQERAALAVSETYTWAGQRVDWLAGEVVDQFARDGGSPVPQLRIDGADDVLAGLVALPEIDRGALTLPQKVLIGMRGSYSGVLMIGLLTSLAGMALVNPISVGAGLIIGGKAYRDDRLQRLQRRQGEAKTAVRRHLDEVVFQVGKELKDRLRLAQRTLRDLVTETADEMHRALGEDVRAAQRGTRSATADRDQRIRALRSRLDQLTRLSRDVRAVRPAAGPGGAVLPFPTGPARAAR